MSTRTHQVVGRMPVVDKLEVYEDEVFRSRASSLITETAQWWQGEPSAGQRHMPRRFYLNRMLLDQKSPWHSVATASGGASRYLDSKDMAVRSKNRRHFLSGKKNGAIVRKIKI